MDKNTDRKEIKIFVDAETKEWLKKLAQEQNKPLRVFVVDSLKLLYQTSYLDKELLKLKQDSSNIINHIKSIKVN